ncbi:sensor histidine kinase [Clostridium frigidicarnis]|uniref:histidine kinase n=1 Tax=Clostridium frigidicarnis TaxID=84698 RepID=A0A1I0ZH90_9CLOT|nr:Spo0B domain-containing protein [Clostridium frigidicarnis]SFB24891.1 Histidine kinase-, DNA gyrase B-, and HSP90-like ATPase [Clostridium frigidicarnis]
MNVGADNVKKILMASAISNGILMAFLILIAVYNILFRCSDGYIKVSYTNGGIICLAALIIIVINIYFTVKSLYSSIFSQDKNKGFIETIDSLSDLNKTLRSQRHDFVNHLQIIYNLMELEEYSDARNYIEKVYEDVIRVNKALKTKSAAVNAILQAKTMYAQKRNINVNLYVNTSLKDLPLPDWQFCRIIVNIIDNGIYALMEKKDNRILTIELLEDMRNYKVTICNNGKEISSEIIDKLFDAGFSTKGKNGTGMGLSIAKEILNEYGGDVIVETNKMETKFIVSILKKSKFEID